MVSPLFSCTGLPAMALTYIIGLIMSTPNVNTSNLDARYSKPADVTAAINAQAVTDAGQYAPKTTMSANSLGSANNPVTSSSATRPTGLTKVFWQCPSQPTNWIAGDEWINNG